MYNEISVKTTVKTQMINIDRQIADIVRASEVKEGTCVLWVPHTTAAITINENGDPDVVRDILYETEKIIPLEDSYQHFVGNSAAHIKSSIFGFSLSLIIHNSELVLGTWQSIYFCEFDSVGGHSTFGY